MTFNVVCAARTRLRRTHQVGHQWAEVETTLRKYIRGREVKEGEMIKTTTNSTPNGYSDSYNFDFVGRAPRVGFVLVALLPVDRCREEGPASDPVPSPSGPSFESCRKISAGLLGRLRPRCREGPAWLVLGTGSPRAGAGPE